MRLTGTEPLQAALSAGLTLFDTARAYPGNEELLASLPSHARVITKCGMGPGFRPDGKAKSLFRDCEASLRALQRPIELLLLHAPDPRVPLKTSVRALASLLEQKLVQRIGVCNVDRRQLREALDEAPLSAVQVALGAGSDLSLRSGVVQLALERGLWVLAHSPFGGPSNARRLLARVPAVPGATPAQAVLGWLLALHPRVIALPGATRPETVRECAQAAQVQVPRDLLGSLEQPRSQPREGAAEVVLIAGLSGSGKSTQVRDYQARGYARLNRDERGGTLRALAKALEASLAGGAQRVVLDNTYVTRASRHDVLHAAAKHGARVRCVWLDTPLAEAQRNVIERMLAEHGRLLEPHELSDRDPTRLSPRALYTQARVLDPPGDDEGFAELLRVPFVRRPSAGAPGRAFALELAALAQPGELLFGWLPGQPAPEGARTCAHPAGPPVCWCRPPLPGLLLAHCRERGVDPARLTVVGTSAAHEKLAAALGAVFQKQSAS